MSDDPRDGPVAVLFISGSVIALAGFIHAGPPPAGTPNSYLADLWLVYVGWGIVMLSLVVTE